MGPELNVKIRLLTQSDRTAWAAMRQALWPEEDARAHAAEIEAMLKRDDFWGFGAEADGTLVGFAEIASRAYANGCDSRPVPFLEGIWVKPSLRRQKIGGRLIYHVEAFLIERGFAELGSDTEVENHGSQAAHQGWGFHETERVVYFRKWLKPRL